VAAAMQSADALAVFSNAVQSRQFLIIKKYQAVFFFSYNRSCRDRMIKLTQVYQFKETLKLIEDEGDSLILFQRRLRCISKEGLCL
jgi:hypothetical protein